jgi:hypothetical protein
MPGPVRLRSTPRKEPQPMIDTASREPRVMIDASATDLYETLDTPHDYELSIWRLEFSLHHYPPRDAMASGRRCPTPAAITSSTPAAGD